MIPEINLLSLLPCSVLNIQDADQVRSPAPQQPIKDLEQDPTQHPQL